MSYLLKKLKELEEFTPENVKVMLVRNGFIDFRMDLKYEVYIFYKERLAYYKRQRIHNPKTQARYETQKAYSISNGFLYSCLELFD